MFNIMLLLAAIPAVVVFVGLSALGTAGSLIKSAFRW